MGKILETLLVIAGIAAMSTVVYYAFCYGIVGAMAVAMNQFM